MEMDGKQTMIKKINYLKSLAFPDDTFSQATYGGTETTEYAFAPNLILFSIGDLYKNMFGYIESLSFSIDDNTVWSNFNPENKSGGDNSLYPSVIDASIGIKIIENHETKKDGTVTKYKYNFDGRGAETIKEEKIPSKPKTFNTDGTVASKPIASAPVSIKPKEIQGTEDKTAIRSADGRSVSVNYKNL